MLIPPADAKDFMRIIQNFDLFLQSRLRMLKDASFLEIYRLRAAGFADQAHFTAYAKENPDDLTTQELEEVMDWRRHGVIGSFIILRERKEGCLFLGTDNAAKVYLVQGITQPISEIVPFLPCYVDARLVPWRGRIITDGIMVPRNVHFGRQVRDDFNEQAKETIAERGLVTTLPADATPSVPDSAELLNHYLSTAASRGDYARQIQSLRRQSPELEIQYLRHMGKVNGKRLKAALKSKGLAGHFAVLEDTIIAGAPDKATAANCAAALVPAGLLPAVVWLKL